MSVRTGSVEIVIDNMVQVMARIMAQLLYLRLSRTDEDTQMYAFVSAAAFTNALVFLRQQAVVTHGLQFEDVFKSVGFETVTSRYNGEDVPVINCELIAGGPEGVVYPIPAIHLIRIE